MRFPAANCLCLQEINMKRLKQYSAIALLTFMLSISTFAGDIGIGQPAPPPPQPPSATTLGQIETPGGASAPSQADYSVSDVAFDLLQAVLTVF
jgi:hypothetical protein